MKWTPHPYQERAVDFLLDNPQAALFMSMGLGKTATVLTAFNTLKFEMGAVRTMIVVAPLRVALLVWAQEAAKWDHLKHLRVQVLHGDEKNGAIDTRADIYVINYDGLKWLAGVFKRTQLIHHLDMVVFDESTMIKNPRAKRSKVCYGMSLLCTRRVILTGSPVPNNLTDIWHQVKVLDLGARLGTSFTSFKQQYFFKAGYGGYTLVPFRGSAKEISERIADISLTMKAEDYLSMPDRIDNIVEVRLPNVHRDQYDEFEREFFIRIENRGIEVFNAAALSMKLRQFVQGFVYDTDANEVADVHDCKAEALQEIIDGSDSPCLVAIQFRHEVNIIRQKLGDVPVIHGGTSAKESIRLVNEWNAGHLPILLAHPASLAHGVNLQAGGNTVVWFGLSYNLEHYLQFNARLHRQGQTRSVLVHHIIMKDTVDEAVMAAIANKESSMEGLLKHLKEWRHGKGIGKTGGGVLADLL